MTLARVPTCAVLSAVLVSASALRAPGAVSAQSAERDQVAPAPSATRAYDHAEAPVARAVRADADISIDGRLEEDAWSTTEPIADFLQTEPLEGRPVSERTEVLVVFGDDALYVGARLFDRSRVTTRLARRDSGLGDSDSFVLLLDSYHDHETAYRFWTNPSGVKGDAIVTGNGTGGGDSSWDPVWDLATAVVEDGWVVEMRIPFSQLRFSRADEQTWGIQVERSIHRNQEKATFPFTPRLERAGVSRFAHLEGIRGIEPARRLELLPYVVARGEYLQVDPTPGVGFDDPYRSGADYFGGVGLDIKYGITSNVTLDATVNPDFGQVELDPSVINLTAFETQFRERRPFFVEGADIFDFGEAGPTGSVGRPPEMLYSRRIGRSPRGSTPPEAVFSEVPTATTILGAAKVTGRVGEGWSLGILDAVTAQERARFVDGEQQPGRSVVEPAANYFVARARRQFRGGATRVGTIATAVNRSTAGSPLEGRLHGSAFAGGIDFAHESQDRMWLFSGLLAGSRVGGSAESIERTQRSSARYFQRPDATHLELDPVSTSLSGLYVMGFVGKQAGTITMRNGFAWVSPGFESNDLGFQSLADRIYFDTHYQYNVIDPGTLLRSWNVSLSPDAVWNSAGQRILGNVNSNLNLELLNYWRIMGRIQLDAESHDDRLTRGGPMARTPSGYSARVSVNSDTRRAATARTSFDWGSDEAGSRDRRLQVSVDARLRETLRLSFGPSWSRSRSTAQYVSRIVDPVATGTFGARYVFGDLDREALSLETRLDVTFSPHLSLQLYVEPFVSVGDYGALKQLRAPDTFDFLTYGVDTGAVTRAEDGSYDVDPDGAGPAQPFRIADPDFSYRSLLGNAVLRWEWRPGSTLYLVWQQRRVNAVTGPGPLGEDGGVGSFDLGRDLDDMFGVAPDNIVMIKINYWLNP